MTRFSFTILALMTIDGASAQTITCSASFQGYRTCQGPNGYRSMEWENGGRLYGDDNRGNKWMTIPGQWGDTTINRRSGQ